MPDSLQGAGDAFLGALAYFLSEYSHLPLAIQIERACYIASDSVTKTGTQSSYPNKQELPQHLFD